MARLEVSIINPKAGKLLRDLADMDLISIRDMPVRAQASPRKKAKAKAPVKSKGDILEYLSSWPEMTDGDKNGRNC